MKPQKLALFLRARDAPAALGALAATGALTHIIGAWAMPLPYANGGTVPVAIILPLLTACIVATVARVPAPQWEYLSTKPLGILHAGYALTLVGIAGLATAMGSLPLTGELTWIAATRNTLLLCGVGLFATAVGPAGWAWLAPATYVGLVISAGGTPHGVSTWAVLVHPDNDPLAAVVAGTMMSVGILASLRRRAH
jgi:hypothetical protein